MLARWLVAKCKLFPIKRPLLEIGIGVVDQTHCVAYYAYLNRLVQYRGQDQARNHGTLHARFCQLLKLFA